MKPFFLRRLKSDVSFSNSSPFPPKSIFLTYFTSYFKGLDWPASKDCYSRKGPNVHTTGLPPIRNLRKSKSNISFCRRSSTLRWLQTIRTEQQRWILLAAIFVGKLFNIGYRSTYCTFSFKINEQSPPVNVAIANNLNPILINSLPMGSRLELVVSSC